MSGPNWAEILSTVAAAAGSVVTTTGSIPLTSARSRRWYGCGSFGKEGGRKRRSLRAPARVLAAVLGARQTSITGDDGDESDGHLFFLPAEEEGEENEELGYYRGWCGRYWRLQWVVCDTKEDLRVRG